MTTEYCDWHEEDRDAEALARQLVQAIRAFDPCVAGMACSTCLQRLDGMTAHALMSSVGELVDGLTSGDTRMDVPDPSHLGAALDRLERSILLTAADFGPERVLPAMAEVELRRNYADKTVGERRAARFLRWARKIA